MRGSDSEAERTAPYPRAQICAGILAGGRGTRMGGQDKGLLPWAGQPMIVHVAAALRAQAAGVVINANRNLDAYRQLGYEVVADRQPGFAGPLAGMDALLAATDAPWLLLAPCDGPRVAPDLGPRLWRAASRCGADVAVAETHGRLQPVFALLHRRLLPRLQADLAAGCRGAGAWLRAQHMATADFSDCAQLFVNVNTAAELQRLRTASPGRDPL